jgi:hypothetical protein
MMVRRPSIWRDRNYMATVITDEDSLVLMEMTLESIIKTESTIF